MFEKPMFHDLARFRRCIVSMSGYYEWRRIAQWKGQPYRITTRNGERLSIADLWDDTCLEGSDAPGSFAIVTMPATPLVARIHPRMPVILTRGREAAWLSRAVTDARVIRRLIQQYPEANMLTHPVSNAVNNVRNNGPHLILPLPEVTQCALWQ